MEKTGTIALTYVTADTEFSLFRVGEVGEYGGYVLDDQYSAYDISLESVTAPQTLAYYLERDEIQPLMTASTDENGQVIFENLEQAVYLVAGEVTEEKDMIYTPVPILQQIPSWIGEELCYDLNAEVKYESRKAPVTQDVSVLKIWKDAGAKEGRPESIEVQLLKKGTVKDTVTLNDANNWTYEWMDLDGKSAWTVVEKQVPEGYTADIMKDGDEYVITNTSTSVNTGTLDAVLPQTGQLWWPVPLLVCAGLFFVIFGMIVKAGEKHEK